jgi:Flp pilus assembly pilin Flp
LICTEIREIAAPDRRRRKYYPVWPGKIIPRVCVEPRGGERMYQILSRLFWDEQGQDIAEYAVMLAVILVIVVGTIRLIGSNANNVFSQVASSVQ